MAQITTISTKELQRQAAACLEGKAVRVMLCSAGSTGYTEESTVANWQSVEKSGSGYVRFSGTLGTGSYNATTARYELPYIDAAFTCSTTAYSYDRVVVYFNGETYIHSLITESPNITLSPGQTQTYRITFSQDDV